jgi:formimidoylglutamate deiminase
MAPSRALPGFVSAHAHGFQRALRGRAGGRDFWAWRDAMLAEAQRVTVESIRETYELTYGELLAAGYTVVGEFHYLGYDEAVAAADAATAAGIDVVLLYAAYARGGLERFRQESVASYLHDLEALGARGLRVGAGPHSVRACPAEWLREIGRYAGSSDLPLHVHACEQPREIDECLAEHDRRPIELLDDLGCLGPRTTIVHATHASDGELDLIAAAGARVCVCPTTEADLGDGYAPVGRLLERGITLCIGSDANVRIDPLEELRQLDGIARREALRRDVLDPEQLLGIGSRNGADALAIDAWRDVEIDLSHPSLHGVEPADLAAALVSSCSADVVEHVRNPPE